MSKQPAKPVTTGPRFGRATGFERASRDEPSADNIDTALARNRASPPPADTRGLPSSPA